MPIIEIGKNKKGKFAILKVSDRPGSYFTLSGLDEYRSIGTMSVDDNSVKPGPVSKDYVKNLAKKIEKECKGIKENLV